MCILDCLLVTAIMFYMYKAKIWMGVVTSLQFVRLFVCLCSGVIDAEACTTDWLCYIKIYDYMLVWYVVTVMCLPWACVAWLSSWIASTNSGLELSEQTSIQCRLVVWFSCPQPCCPWSDAFTFTEWSQCTCITALALVQRHSHRAVTFGDSAFPSVPSPYSVFRLWSRNEMQRICLRRCCSGEPRGHPIHKCDDDDRLTAFDPGQPG